MKINDMNRWAVSANSMDIQRSKWKQPFNHKTTLTSGFLIPIMCKEVMPGDTFKVDVSAVLRSITPVAPVMDNSFIDLYFFNVPMRLCTKGVNDWQKITGENFSGYWAPSSQETADSTSNTTTIYQFRNANGIEAMSLANYLGLPVMSSLECGAMDAMESKINTFKIVGYGKIWNEWFRSEVTQSPITNWNTFISNSGYTLGSPSTSVMQTNKIFDYFTGALPAPQKSASVMLPLGTSAPVLTSSTATVSGAQQPLTWRNVNGNALASNYWNVQAAGTNSGRAEATTLSSGSAGTAIYPNNLYADLSQATAATINQIRLAFALQRYAEKLARGGSRYREWVKVMFNVNIADSVVQVPEYLGGMRMPLNISQVLQTSQTDTTPLGTTGAFSNTAFSRRGFVKSFTENGYLYCVATIRTQQSYSQGISKEWYRNAITDWYTPTFANIGEQPIYKSELFARGNAKLNHGDVFGYQEAWAEYRYNPTLITGYLAPDANDATLTAWTYTNKFLSNPVLNSSFLYQPKSQIGDTLVVKNGNYQFLGDFYFDIISARPMPLFSIPGLLDHH